MRQDSVYTNSQERKKSRVRSFSDLEIFAFSVEKKYSYKIKYSFARHIYLVKNVCFATVRPLVTTRICYEMSVDL